MGKRVIRAIVVAVFCGLICYTVWRMPRMSTDATHQVAEPAATNGVPDYTAMSEKELLVLAYDGDGAACYQLGMRYDYGIGETQQNFQSALGWYRAADAYGQAEAASAIGYLYLNGCGMEEDPEQAVSYFSRAVTLGEAQGYVGLGRAALAVLASDSGAAARAYENFRIASEAGEADGVYFMAYLYEKGIGVPQDYEQAAAMYEAVAKREDFPMEDSYAVHDAATRLGLLYMAGNGVEESPETARDYFRLAAEDGYAMAQYYLGIIYETGNGTTVSYEDALNWLELAAQQDYAPALNEIGYMYYTGRGVNEDYEQAVYYQKLAAALGYEKAQINLGYLYENGYGVERNLPAALGYYRMALATGYPGAEEATARVQTAIDEQQAELEEAVREQTSGETP